MPVQVHTPYWLRDHHVGRSASHKENEQSQTAFAEHVGMPHDTPDEWTTGANGRYFGIATVIHAWESTAISLLRGPGGENGMHAMMQGGEANDTAWQRSAIPAYLDRVRTFVPNPGDHGTNEPGSEWRECCDALGGYWDVAPWTGVPDQIHKEYESFSGGDGSVSWNLPSNFNWATEEVLEHRIRLSHDGMQYKVFDDAGRTGTISGLQKGATYWGGMQRRSESGWGVWSPHYPHDYRDRNDTSRYRNIVQTTRSDSDTARITQAGYSRRFTHDFTLHGISRHGNRSSER